MNDLIERVERRLGTRPRSVTPLSGGCIGSVYRAILPDGTSVVVKAADAGGTLDIEGFMLGYLADHSGLPVPRVLVSEPDLLIMEFVPGRSRFDDSAQRHAAELLADVHSRTSTHFGFERATLIGGLPQPNGPRSSWIEFFRDQRLMHMADAALEEGGLGRSLHSRLARLASRLPEFLGEPRQPALIHGDVWTTNVLAEGGRITAFLDPAIHYADPEIELAFITLFNTFGQPFFDRYQKLRPIRAGFFEVRRHVYNLYPLLVHVRLFGGSYAESVSESLSQLGL
jgi:fructosamine-3-kinase